MKKFSLLAIACLSVLIVVNSWAQQKNDWVCIPGQRVGIITYQTSENDLKSYFGEQNVSTETEEMGEGGEERNITYCFKGTSNEVKILWLNDNLLNPTSIFIRGKSSQWQIQEGIKIGTSLDQLNKINQEIFRFSGFEWDYGGQVNSWGTGKLSKYKNYLSLTLEASNTGNNYSNYIGDQKKLKSNDKGIADLNIVVSELVIVLVNQKLEQPKSSAVRKLKYLYYSNGGLIGYFDDGSISACPRCELEVTNVKTLNSSKPFGTFVVQKDGSLLVNGSEKIKPSPKNEFIGEGWAVINYKWLIKL